MLPRVYGFNCSHALPFNIDKRTRGGRQALRASGGCVPGRRIPAQQAGELRDGEHRARPAQKTASSVLERDRSRVVADPNV
jgi:hypothetical protein